MAGALPPRPPLPPDSRTRISISPGTPAQKVEDAFQLAADSPVVSAWPFVNWVFSSAVGNANQRFAEATRSHLVWPILMGSRRPMDSDMDRRRLVISLCLIVFGAHEQEGTGQTAGLE